MAYFAEPLARALAALGRLEEAIAAIDEALKLHEAARISFMLPELLRAKGELLVAHFPEHSVDAEALLRLSYELAQRQGALAWQLRAAMSLARLHSSQGRAQETYLLLRDTYLQFTEGFDTRDLLLAKQALKASTGREPINQRSRKNSRIRLSSSPRLGTGCEALAATRRLSRSIPRRTD
jgi:predicted ATPase